MIDFRNIFSPKLSYMINRGIDMDSDFHAFRLQIGGGRGDPNMLKIQSSIRKPGILHGTFPE